LQMQVKQRRVPTKKLRVQTKVRHLIKHEKPRVNSPEKI
jgi:hypothetical protein